MGIDIAVIEAVPSLPNGATSATIGLTTGGESYFPAVVTFRTDLYAPVITASKQVTDLNGGAVQPGDVLEYSITVENSGQDAANGVMLRDAIPANTTYVPGTLQVTQGANSGPKSDTPGNDQAEFDAVGNQVVFRLGTGASAGGGGTLGVGPGPASRTTLAFRVLVNPGVPTGARIDNQANVGFTAATLGTPLTAASNLASITVGPADLAITKQHEGVFVQGTGGTYTLAVANVGGQATSGTVTVSDTLPAGLTPVSASGTGWSCAIGGQTVTCQRSDVLPPAASYPPIALSVACCPGVVDLQVTNTATVSGGGDASPANNTASDPTTLSFRGDLAITKTNNASSVVAGGQTTYTITVTNAGPTQAFGFVEDVLPPEIAAATWTCTPDASAACAGIDANGNLIAPEGTGNILALVDIQPGGSLTFTVEATLAAGASGVLTNTAIVTPFPGVDDPNASNDSATDSDPILAPTPTPTATPSATATATATGSATPSATATATPTETASPTATATPTGTATPSATPTATPTGTSAPSAPPTEPPTSTPTSSPTSVAPPTETASPTATATSLPAPSPTPTPSAAPSPSSTPTPLPPDLPTSTATGTPTGTATPTAPATATLTPTPVTPAPRCGTAGLICHADLTLVPDGGETGTILVAFGTTNPGPCASPGSCVQFTVIPTGLAVQGQLTGLRPGDTPSLRIPLADDAGSLQGFVDFACSLVGADGRAACAGTVGQPDTCVALGVPLQVRANRPVPTPSATATASATPTPVPSATATATPPPSATAVPTTTATLTPGPSPTPTATASATATATATPTRTATPRPASTPTAPPTAAPACPGSGSICRAVLTPAAPEVVRGPAERGTCAGNAPNCLEIANTGAGLLIQGIAELTGPPAPAATLRLAVADASGRSQGTREIVCPAAGTPGRYVCNALIAESGICVQLSALAEIRLAPRPATLTPRPSPTPSPTPTSVVPPRAVVFVPDLPAAPLVPPLLPPLLPPPPLLPVLPPPPLGLAPPEPLPLLPVSAAEVPRIPEAASGVLLLAGLLLAAGLARGRRLRP
jgi:uncharacterized repeat protein (TIGR01451 family)